MFCNVLLDSKLTLLTTKYLFSPRNRFLVAICIQRHSTQTFGYPIFLFTNLYCILGFFYLLRAKRYSSPTKFWKLLFVDPFFVLKISFKIYSFQLHKIICLINLEAGIHILVALASITIYFVNRNKWINFKTLFNSEKSRITKHFYSMCRKNATEKMTKVFMDNIYFRTT